MNISLVISYCCLGIMCLSCLCSPPYDLFIFLALMTTFVYALLGALKEGLAGSELLAILPEDNIDWTGEIDKYLALASNLLPLFALPCLTVSMWLNQDYVNRHFSLLHFILALAASAGAVFQKLPKSAIDAIVVCTSTSLLFIGLATYNVYAVYADIYFIIAHFCTHHIQRSIKNYSPVEDLYQYFLSVFVTFAVKSANASIRNYNGLEKAGEIVKTTKISKLPEITEIAKHAAIAGSAKLVHAVNVAKIAGINNLGLMGVIAEYASAVASLVNLSDGFIDAFFYLGKTFLDFSGNIYQQLKTSIPPICKLKGNTVTGNWSCKAVRNIKILVLYNLLAVTPIKLTMNIAEEISYFTLIAASAGSLYVSNTDDTFFISVAGVILIYAVLGALRKANISDTSQKDLIEKGHEHLKALFPVVVLPSLVTEVWLRYGIGKKTIHKNFGMIHSVVGMLTSFVYSTQPSMDQKYMDGMVGVETVSLVGAGLYMENFYAAAAGVAFVAAYYLTQYYNGSDLRLPKEDLYNYLLAGFVLLAMRSTTEQHKCPFM